ncbi:hypothetical protein G3R49_01955 [Shewanella sp. WXL01]|uniref:DUF302 domain-containing protein n=1 Tax=Shewanella maritima TaxID=2520507 RepID=A0A411PG49_9GAMM|nr:MULTISPECIES: hypothetical protein [Shewanella]NKF49344.1 hypothetical protein [Shewanella sp. WXL01]QBF82533.1 hypothetical protein EXU30_07360 [Shewanella maritima]
MKKLIMAAALTLMSANAVAEKIALPPLNYTSYIGADELYDKLKQSEVFSNLDKENFGTPIRLIVRYRTENTAGGSAAGFTSAILAGGSLGILPVVTNNDFVLTYELTVQNQVIAAIEYRENFTEAANMYQAEDLHRLDGDELVWVMTTAEQFIEQVQADPEVRSLIEEYDYYFGE